MMKALWTTMMLVAFAVSPNALGQEGDEPAPAFIPDEGALDAEREAANSFKNLDQDIQDLKKEVLDLNTELFLLEEELLFPANTCFLR